MWSPGSDCATRGSGSTLCMAAPRSCPSTPIRRAGRASSSVSQAGGPMPRALVVDDEPLARERIRTLLRGHPGVELAGFGVLAHLTPREIPVTVFITAYDRHALRAFEVGAADYVLKPIVRARFD